MGARAKTAAATSGDTPATTAATKRLCRVSSGHSSRADVPGSFTNNSLVALKEADATFQFPLGFGSEWIALNIFKNLALVGFSCQTF